MSKIKEIYSYYIEKKPYKLMNVRKYVSSEIKQTIKNEHNSFYMPNMNEGDIISDCKKKCVQALQGKNPFEKVFILDAETGKIVKELNGDLNSCYIDKIFLQKGLLKILHGHPAFKDKCTSPVSFGDFKLLNESKNVDEIIVYDSLGSESALRKNENYNYISNIEFNRLKEQYIQYLMEFAESQDRNKILELQNYCREHKNSRAVQAQIAELITDLQYKKNGIDAIDAFWKDNAEKLNMTYKAFKNY